MTWDGVVTTYHKRYIKELGIQPSLEAYIQSVVLKKTLESISLERRRGHDQSGKLIKSNFKYVEGITMDPINNNRGDILNPEDLTDSNTGEVKNSHIISSVPEHEAILKNNNHLRNQNKSNIIENCKSEKNSSLLCKHNSCDSIIPRNNFKIKKGRSWKNYLFEDGYSFQDDVIEMYNKYKCNIFYNSAKNIKNIDDLCANEKLNTESKT
ncbi:hypothetical protein NAPIS_ORF00285 [Vairimorpha apis BRL 01]|uniref:Uncharacterized protein n=1 Tax=Vairimorpha apis BRL 01 TaxID=1037528 RepID=T0MG99_9MICR|nr:hypothetical protein NAPIS_ORF00285 [Vairimorpha apis BRL 01]